jgi:putative ABC transport system permease protein
MWRATLKSLLAKKVRLALTALAVVLGVGFMAGTYVLTDTMNKAFDEVFTTATQNVDVVVRAVSAFEPNQAGPGGGGDQRNPVPGTLISLVESVPGVATVDGSVSGYAQLVDPKTGEAIGATGAPNLGVSWNEDSTALTLKAGEPPANDQQVAIDAATAAKHDLSVGDRVQVLFVGPPQEFTISGIVGFGNADNLAGATLAVFDVQTAQEVFGHPNEYDELNVVGETGVSADELRDRVAARLPDGYEAVTGATIAQQNSDQLKQALGFLQTALLVFAFVALFVGAFIIFNTFSIIVAQRTRELALLRALGASRRQVTVSVMLEAAVVGLVASAVGVGAGVLIAIGLQAMLKGFGIDLPSTSTQLLPRTIIVSIVVGTVVTFASSVIPARRASKVAPIQAMRDGAPASGASLRRRVITAVAITVAGVAALAFGLFGGSSNAGALVGLGALLTFLGVAGLAPLVARPLAAGIGAPLARLGVSGKLGRENAMRSPRRTASTAAALMIGLGLVSFVAVFAASLRSSSAAALDETLRSDFVLSTSGFTPFSPQLAKDLRLRPELGAVSPIRQGQVLIDGTAAIVTGVDPPTIGQVASIGMESGSIDSLGRGDVLVYEAVARAHGWAVGDTIRIEFARTGVQELTVGGIFSDNRVLDDLAVSNLTYARNYADVLDGMVFVTAAPGVSIAEARAAIEEVAAAYPNVEVNDQAQFKERTAGFIDQILALVSALLGLAILIALFGIVNTLGLSIFERTRELGLLRAVGMSRRQVRSMIRSESVIIAVLGAVLGVAVGVLFGVAMQRALADSGVSKLSIPPVQLLTYVVLAALAGVLAAILPARRAARLNVLQAISYE